MSSVYGRPYTPQMVTQKSPQQLKKKNATTHTTPQRSHSWAAPPSCARQSEGLGWLQDRPAAEGWRSGHLPSPEVYFPPRTEVIRAKERGLHGSQFTWPPQSPGHHGRGRGCSLGADSLSCEGVGVLRASSHPPSRERPSGDQHRKPSFKSCSW